MSIIHREIGTIYGFLWAKLLDKTPDHQALVVSLLLLQVVRNWLKLTWINRLFVKKSVLLGWEYGPLLRFDAAKVPRLGDAKLARNDLVKVQSSGNPNYQVEQKHQNTTSKRVPLVHVRHLCQRQPIGRVQIVEEYELHALIHAHIWENTEGILQTRATRRILDQFTDKVRKPKEQNSSNHSTLPCWEESYHQEAHSILAHHVHHRKKEEERRANVCKSPDAQNNCCNERRNE